MIRLLLLFFFIAFTAKAQFTEFWGTTYLGGEFDAGYVFKMDTDGSDFQIIHELDGESGGKYMGSGMTLGSDGMLYGVVNQGGEFGNGFIYRIDPAIGEFEIQVQFEDSIYSNTTLKQASNGKFYGFGSVGLGCIFEFDPETSEYQIVYKTTRPEGVSVLGTGFLTEVEPNMLYGTFLGGGGNNEGSLFSFDIETRTLSVEHSFERSTGQSPASGLLLASNGKLYGTCWRGGEFNDGVLFEFDPKTKDYVVKANFHDDIIIPTLGLIEGVNGKIYGTASIGGSNFQGALYEYDMESEAYQVLINFGSGGSGSNNDGVSGTGQIVDAPVMLAENGKLYGLSRYGGSGKGLGQVYSYDPETKDFELVASLNDGFPLETALVEAPKNIVAGISDDPKTSLRLYPNPASDYLIIETNNRPLPKEVCFYNLQGQKEKCVQPNSERIELEGLKDGVYLVRAFNIDRTTSTSILKTFKD